jgi:GNAT superfamily N-acetyltransferase
MKIGKFRPSQAEAVSKLIRRGLLEINSKDYEMEFIISLVDYFSPAQIVENARTQDVFVAAEEGKVIGTAGLANFGSPETPRYFGVAVFVLPERQGRGIGKQLMGAVEARAQELGAQKITVRAAINAQGFYLKLGYQFQDGKDQLDEKGYYILVKMMDIPTRMTPISE